MKKKLLSLVTLSSLVLGACQMEAEEDSPTQDDETTENVNEEETAEDAEETDDEVVEETEETEYLYEINPDTFSVMAIDDEKAPDEKLALLTFDDAPYGNSLKIADDLEAKDLSAIFFVNGMYMEDDEGLAVIEELHERGFEIGNHTQTHLNLSEHPEDVQKEEIMRTSELIEEATGESPRFFRAPHGVMTDYSKELLADLGMTWMNWSFGYDWESEYQDASALAEITLNSPYLSDGANILMHDREWTAAAVPEIIEGLDDLGYTMVDPKLIVNPYDEDVSE